MITLDQIKDFVEDPSHYPSTKGFRDAGSPAFVFFDDDKGLTPDESWMKAEAVKFEKWLESRPEYIAPDDQPKIESHLERIEQLRKDNWQIGWERRKPANNDAWRKLMMPLIENISHPEHGAFCREVIKCVRDNLPFAQGPIRSTVFVNPDGSRHETAGTDYGRARKSFINRHKLSEEYVSCERVQYEGEKTSKIVVGTRRTSDQVASHYYDPNPQWAEKVVKGEWVKAYQPSTNNLYRLGEGMTMPFGSHRLTVREFEQAVIAGAETFEDEDEAYSFRLEHNISVDDRIRLMDNGKGFMGRTIEAMNETEQFLYEILMQFEEKEACEILQLKEPEEIKSLFWDDDNPEKIEDLFQVDENKPWTKAALILRRAIFLEKWQIGTREVMIINQINGQPQRKIEKFTMIPEDTKIHDLFKMIVTKKEEQEVIEKRKPIFDDPAEYGCNELAELCECQ